MATEKVSTDRQQIARETANAIVNLPRPKFGGSVGLSEEGDYEKSISALILRALEQSEGWVKVRKLIAAINKADDYLYCERNCTAFGIDKNFCSCGRRDKFGELLAAYDEVETNLQPSPPKSEETANG